MKPKISIIVPTLNEESYIKNCIESILDSTYEQDKMEILIIDGMSSDKTREIVKSYTQKYNFIKLVDNSKKIVPVAMNIGIKQALGEYIIRLDAHASYPKEYFSKLIKWHKELNADNIGAVIKTKVKSNTPKANAIAKVLSCKFGVGNSDFRVGVDKPKEVDTVPFGCYKKDVFEKFGLYDERLIRNQDIELNKRIISNGGKIYLVPDVKCVYYAREDFISLAKNNFSNGKWNILTAFYTKTLNSLSFRHFVPLFFVLSLILPSFLSFVFPNLLWISIISLSSYASLVIMLSVKLGSDIDSIMYLICSFFILHFSYGAGSLMGILTVITIGIKARYEQ